MRRDGATNRRWMSALIVVFVSAMGGSRGLGAEVTGVVRMPEICSPAVSPAVVYLSRMGAKGRAIELKAGAVSGREIALVNQQGLQFTPRVQAIVLGQSVRFGNKDGETHNVHVITRGLAFNQSMAPGNSVDFTPDRPGVMTLACDIHSHMRGFVVVSPTPWVQVCSRQGRFRLEDVPDGRYELTVWHEMGEPLRQEIVVADGKGPAMPELVLTGPSNPARVGGAVMPVRPWPDVIDRIGVDLAASRDAANAGRVVQGDAAGRRRLFRRVRSVRHGDGRSQASGIRAVWRTRAWIP